jgi:ribosome biogenesis GTPase A
VRQISLVHLKLVSAHIDMANQGAPQNAKKSNLKGFRNRLKKVFGGGMRSSSSTSPAVIAPPAVVASPSTVAVPPASALPPADLAPTVSTITTDPEEAAKLRAKYTHFRILVIGRANAGKTTLLKRVCNTEEDPVYSEV